METVCCQKKPKTVLLLTETENTLLSDKWNWKQFVVRQVKLKTIYCQTSETENCLLPDMKLKTVSCQTYETENILLSGKWNRKQFVVRQKKLKTVYCQTNETENSLVRQMKLKTVCCQTNENWKQFVVRQFRLL